MGERLRPALVVGDDLDSGVGAFFEHQRGLRLHLPAKRTIIPPTSTSTTWRTARHLTGRGAPGERVGWSAPRKPSPGSLNPTEFLRVWKDVSTRTLGRATITVVEPPDGEDELSQLYRAHAPAARRLAYLLVGDREEADDLVQDCFVRLTARRTPVDDLPAYLRRAVVNAANSWMRKRAVRRRRAHEAALAYGPGGLGDAVAPDASASVVRDDGLRRALLELPERQRTAVVLRHYLDLSELECADLMDCSVGTVKAAASRGRARLAELLGGRDG